MKEFDIRLLTNAPFHQMLVNTIIWDADYWINPVAWRIRMPRIAIITDTDASLPKSVSDGLGIHQVPIAVNFGTHVLKTGIDIDDRSLFVRVAREGKLPATSAPAQGDYSTAFENAFET